MIWDTLFISKILSRGQQCYKEGAVVGLHRGPAEWQALVVGSELYRVNIGLERGKVTALRCNCPYAHDGSRCKHMAALLYSLDGIGPDVLQDDDAALTQRLDELSPYEVERLLQLAIDAGSTRCTAVLLNNTASGPERFSPDDFTLDDLPEDALSVKTQDVQGDNDALKLLFQ